MSIDLDMTLARAQHAADRAGQSALARRGEASGDDPAALAEAAVQFETVLLKQLVSAMRATISTGAERSGDQLTEHLIEDALATHLARSGGVGLAELIVRDAGRPLAAPGPDELLAPEPLGPPDPTAGGAERYAPAVRLEGLQDAPQATPAPAVSRPPARLEYTASPPDAADLLRRLLAPGGPDQASPGSTGNIDQ